MSAHAVTRKALLLLLALAALPGLTKRASASSPESADVRVFYWVDQVLGPSYVSQIMLTNMTPAPIEAWTLGFDLDPAAQDMRNVQWDISGTRHTVSGAGWTRKINPGESVFFAFDGLIPGDGSMTTVNEVPRPTNCFFNGQICSFEEVTEPQTPPHDTLAVDVGWWVATQGVSQFRAQILLKNTTDQRIENWNLKFRSTSLITNIENGDWSSAGANYEVSGRGWTRQIDPEEMIWLTLTGVHTGKVDTLESCIFNGFPCTFVDPDDFVDAPNEPEIPERLCSTFDTEETELNTHQLKFTTKIESYWNNGYVYNINVANNTEKAVRNWTLKFKLDKDMTITNMWNAKYTGGGGGGTYTVRPEAHINCIEPGESVGFGFEGAHKGLPVLPSGCQFDGQDCLFSRSSTVSTDTESGDFTRPLDQFEIGAPYPNPFASQTRIPFKVQESQDVDVTMWDMQGRQVNTLFSGPAAAGQLYEITVPSGTLKSGVYMVRLTGASGAGVTTPVMLVR